jgi:hypothetical protein
MLRSLRRQIAPAGRVRTTTLALTSDAHPKQSAYRAGGTRQSHAAHIPGRRYVAQGEDGRVHIQLWTGLQPKNWAHLQFRPCYSRALACLQGSLL